jgi:hypothetical protein
VPLQCPDVRYFRRARRPRIAPWRGVPNADRASQGFEVGESDSEPASDPAERIEQLELRIEELQEAIQRSRRLMLVGRACAILGPALLVCLMLGVLRFTPFGMIIGISLGMGGLVLMGSSKASTEELDLSLRQADNERNAAIDALELLRFGD